MSYENYVESGDIDFYRNIVSSLKLLRGNILNIEKNDEEVIKTVNSEVLLNMFETYKKTTIDVIQKLTEENIRLTNELKSAYYYFSSFENRTNNILSCKNDKFSTLHNRIEDSCLQTRNQTQNIRFLDNDSTTHSQQNQQSIENFISKINKKKEYLIENLNELDYLIRSHRLKLNRKQKKIENLNQKVKELKNENKALFENKLLTPKVENSIESNVKNIPRWLPDQMVTECKICSSHFGFFNRRHHCRVCGDIFCSTCSNHYANFKPFYQNIVRMCRDCQTELKKNKNNLHNSK